VGAVLRSSDSDLARAKLKGKGGTLPDPALPLTPPVTAQLINSSNGVCFESTFADLRINDGTRVKARARP
jgi:hypothetical protein